MTCPRCQQDNPPQARFCLRCGGGFAKACTRCDTELPAEAQFCFACGHVAAAPRGSPDKQEQARDHLTAATTMYREMDVRFWLEQAERGAHT